VERAGKVGCKFDYERNPHTYGNRVLAALHPSLVRSFPAGLQ
jgi:hypothetical protein